MSTQEAFNFTMSTNVTILFKINWYTVLIIDAIPNTNTNTNN